MPRSLAVLFTLLLPANAESNTHLPLRKNLTTSAVVFDDNFEDYAVPFSPSALNKPATASALMGTWSYGTSSGNYTIGVVNPVRSVSGAVVMQEGGQCLMLSTTAAGTHSVNLTLPVEKSSNLDTWQAAGSLQLTLPKEANMEFYRLKVK